MSDPSVQASIIFTCLLEAPSIYESFTFWFVGYFEQQQQLTLATGDKSPSSKQELRCPYVSFMAGSRKAMYLEHVQIDGGEYCTEIFC
ncbi:hypothetical protein C5167_033825 [Papaver somniferum]|uniref:Uncharacterized protein n=1 Tax=Papaver somniferum TaxID=3469 RepID=A0A4Y7KFK9_PAPSO|nr:hypothetical protein C5167_033825 [Papaver somniferum]